jgi:hypothetical protein
MTNDNYLFRIAESPFYEKPAPIFALDYYQPDTHGEDDFSRKQVWFYVYGDDDIEREFREKLIDLFDIRFVQDETDWDLITVYPTHIEDGVNPHMIELFQAVGDNSEIPLNQVLRRNETIAENHNLDSLRQKVVNVEDTIDLAGDIEGKNVILVDNISISGSSLLHGARILEENGAEKVACVCLGISAKNVSKDRDDLPRDMGATDIMNKFENHLEKSVKTRVK